MIVIKDLELQLAKDMRTLISGFNFSFVPNQKIALIGEEGNGKSSLLKAIYDKSLISDYIDISGSIFKEKEIIGYLPQHLPNKLNNISIRDFIYGKDRDIDYSKLYRFIDNLGIKEELLDTNIRLFDLSGGEKIKIQLLDILLDNPTVLLLDEPTNDLDIDSIIWLENFINSQKIPIMFISHDERLLENCANTVILFEQLSRKTIPTHTIEKLDYKSFVSKRWNTIETQEKNAKKEREILDKKLERYREIYDKVDRAQRTVSRQDPAAGKNLKDKMHTVKSIGKRFEKEEENLTQRPDFEESIYIKFNEGIGVPKGKQILELKLEELLIKNKILSRDINLTVIGPEKICIVGRNGSGKTTLLKQIRNNLNSNINAFYMPQNYLELLDVNQTPVEYLAKDSTKDEQTRVRTYLGSLKFTKDEMEHNISNLSGGQVAKLYFSNLTSGDYEALILDEPTRNLSPLSGPEIRNALKDFKGVIISVSHDRKYIEEVCDKMYLLDEVGLHDIDKNNFLESYENDR